MKFKEIEMERILNLLEGGEILFAEIEVQDEPDKVNMIEYCMLETIDGDHIYLERTNSRNQWEQFFEIPLKTLLCCRWFIDYDDEEE